MASGFDYLGVLCKVVSGWSGTLTLTNTSTSVSSSVTPRPRSSALEVMLDFVREARRVHGVEVFFYVNSFVKVVFVIPGVTFNLSATGTTGTKLGLTSSATGVTSSHIFPDVIPNSAVPPYGARVRLPLVSKKKGDSLLAGGLGVKAGNARSGGSLILYGDLSTDFTLAGTLAAGGVYDFAIPRTNDATNITTLSRFMLSSVGVGSWGRLGSMGRVRCAIQGVSE